MLTITRCILISSIMFYSDAVTFREQLDHIARRRRESRGLVKPSRRQFNDQASLILGAPTLVSHLPEAEPILPGHTLIRPARGMLKSAVKYPHIELDNGAGVYGNVHNLGIRYDGRNQRVQYSGFRRTPDNIIVAVPNVEPQVSLSKFFELSDRSDEYETIKKIKLRSPKHLNGMIIHLDNPPPRNINYRHIRGHLKPHHRYQESHREPLPESYNENMFKKILTRKPRKKRFKRPGTRPRQMLSKSPIDYDVIRRDQYPDEEASGTPLFDPNEDSSYDYYTEARSEEKKKEVSKEIPSKMDWFWKSKDAYNNIKISQDAPDITDLLPTITEEKIRQWWFYHQDDFVPFEE